MKEKFADYEGTEFLSKEGKFLFEITSAELKDSKNGDPMWVFGAKSDEGQTTLYHSLNPKARWSFNNLIKACLRMRTKEQIKSFECDYETIGQELVGKTFIGNVEEDTYEKPIKRLNDDGEFVNDVELRTSYKVTSYEIPN